ncbi:MAG: O-antigen ligase family protein [Aquamicrobium sp.]|uniref:O-antigen ligase family protein n=1 Tax=Aquamicrobium sp. TaxID=1872579 RepID=UPI00349EF69A|nr:O-antigen ligase family protein [Aquamicrobium sp.]
MSAVTANGLPRAAVEAKAVSLLASAGIAVGVFLQGFVINEPAPYELFMVGLIAVWALFGMRLSRHAAILLTLLVAYNIGGVLSMGTMSDLHDTPLYIGVTLFLSLSAVFFVAILEADPARYTLIFRAWLASALIVATLGIAGYFGLFPGAEAFTRYGRASGTFADPNVFGPFLALPGVYMLYRVLTAPARRMPLYGALLTVITGGIFLSFSRGAWGLYLVAFVLLVGALFLQSTSGLFRLRVALMSALAVAFILGGIVVALQIPGTAEFLAERARLVQSYDGGESGRFARFGDGFLMAMENPLGIGPLNFGRLLGEDTHNIWLKALMDYGWLGFAAFVALVAWTLAGGFRILFRDRPWQPYLLCAYVVFIGHLMLGTVIDMDHWRHFYVLVGLIWGAMALEARHQNAARAAAGRRAAPAR